MITDDELVPFVQAAFYNDETCFPLLLCCLYFMCVNVFEVIFFRTVLCCLLLFASFFFVFSWANIGVSPPKDCRLKQMHQFSATLTLCNTQTYYFLNYEFYSWRTSGYQYTNMSFLLSQTWVRSKKLSRCVLNLRDSSVLFCVFCSCPCLFCLVLCKVGVCSLWRLFAHWLTSDLLLE